MSFWTHNLGGRRRSFFRCPPAYIGIVVAVAGCANFDALFEGVADGSINPDSEILRTVDPNLCDRHGNSLLKTAARGGRIDIVEMLLRRKADVNLANELNWTPLMSASLEGHESVVRHLLDNGADVNVVNANRHTALMHAAFNGHSSIVKMLLARGADPTLRNHVGKTAVQDAQERGFTNIVNMLSEASMRNIDGTSLSVTPSQSTNELSREVKHEAKR